MGKFFCDPQWEEWSRMTRKDLIRKCPPSRILVTVFAQKKGDQSPEPSSISSEATADNSEPAAKRLRHAEPLSPDLAPTRQVPNVPEVENPAPSGHHASHGPKFMKLSPEQKQQLLRMHNNLGHPDATLLGNVLRDQQWPAEAIDGIRDMHCPACFENQKPKPARPSHLGESRQFNDVVAIDAVTWTSASGQNFTFYHMIDMASNYQIAFPCEHRPNCETMAKLVTRHWIQWAGPPGMLVHDSAGEFCGEEFGQFLQSYDVRSRVIPAESHWQLSRCGRHGGILQSMLDKWQVRFPIASYDDLEQGLVQCTAAKNSLSRHRGYSPEILVLGKSRHHPAANSTNDENTAAEQMLEGSPEESSSGAQAFMKNLEMREQARLAFVRADHDVKLRRALLRRNRPMRETFSTGQWVMYWRNGKGAQPGMWNGPAKVVLCEDHNVTWITHQSRLYRCAPEHLRTLSEREAKTPEVAGQAQPIQFPAALGTGVFQYHDLTNQGTIPSDMHSPPANNNFPNNPDPSIPNVNTNETNDHAHNPNLNSPHNGVTNLPESGTEPEVQPDAEPDANSQNSGTQTPPQISPDITNPDYHQLPSEIPRGGLDVAIPENDDDNSLMTTHLDHWEIQSNQVIRHHVQPRHKLFQPYACGDCPINPEWLTSQRTSNIHTIHDQEWSQQDEWRGNMCAHMSMPVPWTGSTVFVIKPMHQKECPTQQQYVNYCNAQPQKLCEISLVLDAQEIMNCSQQEPLEQISFLASSAKRQRSEVKEKSMTPQDRALFQAAKAKEVVSWLSTETVRKIARSQIPEDQILRSRWVLTWKPLEKPVDQTDPITGETKQVTHKPKARLVILGFEDPQLENLARDSPTMGRDSRSLIFQFAASSRWRIRSFDIQTAFLRGRRQDGRILGMDPPEEMRAHMKLKPWECCELLKSAYGLCNAPLLWYEELKGALLSLNFKMSPLDPCVFALPRADGKGIHGIVGIHVVDGLGAGDHVYESAIKELENRYPFGSKLETDFTFTGIHVHQNWDGSIELDQCKYIEDIPNIEVPKSRRQNLDQAVNDHERQSLRALVGSIQYAASNTRPDLSAKLSLLQAKITSATIKDLLEGNRLLQEAKAHKNTKITYKNIPIHDLRFVSFSDASFASRANAQSQKGCLILAASKCIGEWQASSVSPLLWYSRKIARVVASTLASEAYALSGAVDLFSWIRIHWSWMCQPSNEWKNPEQSLSKGPEAYAVVDCKSLYDLIQKTTIPQCSEHRTMLEALVIKDRMKEGVVMKWVHSAAQLADCLTKHMDCSALRDFLRQGRCIIHDVAEVLRVRADKRSKKAWMNQFHEDSALIQG